MIVHALNDSASRTRRLVWGGALLAFGLALAARAWILLSTTESGLFSDMFEYHSRATMLRSGESLPDSFRGPAFPAFVALFYSLPGPDLLMARFGNSLLVSASASMTVILAAEFVGPAAALGAGVIVALYPASLVSAVYLMPESLYGALILATLLFARDMTPGRWAGAGVMAGLTALTRSIGVGLLPAVLVGHIKDWRGGGGWTVVRMGALMTLACLLTLSPWFVHTSRVSGGVMLDSASAYNVLIGANPRARERLEIADGTWVWERYFAGALNEADRNRTALAESWKWIRENPGRWFGLIPKKMAYLWGLEGREHAWAYSNSYFGERSAATATFWGILLLGCVPPLAAGAAFGLFRPGLLASPTGAAICFVLLLTTLMHGISFSETRYHLPLIPLLAILAVRGAAGAPKMTPLGVGAALTLVAGLTAGWWNQWPELADRYSRLTVEGGWKTMLPF